MRTKLVVRFAFLMLSAAQLLSSQVLVTALGSPVTSCPTTPVAINGISLVSVVSTNQTIPARTVITYNFSVPVRGTPSFPSVPEATVRIVNAGNTGAVVVYLPNSVELVSGQPLPLNGVQVDASSLTDRALPFPVPTVADTKAVDLPAPQVQVVRADTSLCPNPVPTITSISPTSTPVTTDPVTLTVNGTNFFSGSVIQYSGSPLYKTFVSSPQLSTPLDSSILLTPA